MIHGQTPESMGLDQDFPNSIEVQLLGGSGEGERSTANLCTLGTQYVQNGKIVTTHCVTSSSKTYNGDQWVRVEVLVLGDSIIKHYVNGEEVIEYEQPQLDPVNGEKRENYLLEGLFRCKVKAHLRNSERLRSSIWSHTKMIIPKLIPLLTDF